MNKRTIKAEDVRHARAKAYDDGITYCKSNHTFATYISARLGRSINPALLYQYYHGKCPDYLHDDFWLEFDAVLKNYLPKEN